ncbi:MAG TPA: hypothetical protein VD861_22165 [Pyrinomonadaceae bacterium]|nr:hypothetical protein [Pyrinomonadaceae bacterium]
MKKVYVSIFLLFGLYAILAAAEPARAQSAREQTASIPFSFNVGDKTFPAGLYRVRQLNPASDRAALEIKSEDGRLGKITLTTFVRPGEEAEQPRLVFTRYGEQYFLAQVWTHAREDGLALPTSRSERTLARKAGERAPERTAIALGRRPR